MAAKCCRFTIIERCDVWIDEPRGPLVTGGPCRIRKAVSLALAKAGAAVAANYRERSEEAASVVDVIHQIGGYAVAVAADVSIAGVVHS